jgi:hypothetical protein
MQQARRGRPNAKRRPARGGAYPMLAGERTHLFYEISAPEAILPGRIIRTHWLRSSERMGEGAA